MDSLRRDGKRHLGRWLVALTSGWIVPVRLRAALLRLLGAELGPGTCIEAGVCIINPRGLRTGRDVFVNSGCLLDATDGIEIEEDATVGWNVTVTSSAHAIGPPTRRAAGMLPGTVRVGRGAWLGAAVQVLPGVTIGPGVVVGAGAVVARDLAADGLYLGVPARRVRDLAAEVPGGAPGPCRPCSRGLC